MSKPMEWNQPPRKKIVPECVGEISSTKECCAVDREEKEEEEDSEVLVPVVCRRELDVPPHGVVSGSAPTWYPLGMYGQAQWHVATRSGRGAAISSDRNCLPRLICLFGDIFLL